MTQLIHISKEYRQLIERLCRKYRTAQIRASISVNEEMLRFYFELGREIVSLKAETKWGTSFMKSLSKDLQHQLPNVTGLSVTNLGYAKRFYLLYREVIDIQPPIEGEITNMSEVPIHPQLGGELFSLPWGHHKV